jgi:hypothetical protein
MTVGLVCILTVLHSGQVRHLEAVYTSCARIYGPRPAEAMGE